MNQPPYIIEEVLQEVVDAASHALFRPVYFHYEVIKELNETLVQYQGSPNLFDKKFPLVLMKQPVTIAGSKLLEIYGEIDELTLFIITGSQASYKTRERIDKSYTPIVNPILYELPNQMFLHEAFLGYPNHFKPRATKYPYWGEAQKNVLSEPVDVMEVKFRGLKIQNRCDKQILLT